MKFKDRLSRRPVRRPILTRIRRRQQDEDFAPAIL
jgi:hypothetical protein